MIINFDYLITIIYQILFLLKLSGEEISNHLDGLEMKYYLKNINKNNKELLLRCFGLFVLEKV